SRGPSSCAGGRWPTGASVSIRVPSAASVAAAGLRFAGEGEQAEETAPDTPAPAAAPAGEPDDRTARRRDDPLLRQALLALARTGRRPGRGHRRRLLHRLPSLARGRRRGVDPARVGVLRRRLRTRPRRAAVTGDPGSRAPSCLSRLAADPRRLPLACAARP